MSLDEAGGGLQPWKALRRDTILESARTLVAEVGYDAVSLELIAERAEVTKPTLYAYFENKDAIILSAYLRVLELSGKTRERIDPAASPLTRLSIEVRQVLEANFLDPRAMFAWPPHQVTSRPEFIEALDHIRNHAADLIREGQACGEISPDLDPLIAAQMYFSIAGNCELATLAAPGALTTTEIVNQLHTIILNSLRRRDGI